MSFVKIFDTRDLYFVQMVFLSEQCQLHTSYIAIENSELNQININNHHLATPFE